MSPRSCLSVLALLPLTWAGPGGAAFAQDIRFTPEATETCLSSEEGGHRISCPGLSAEACINATSDAYTTVGMSACFHLERDYWDARLNAAYGRLMANETAIDADAKTYGYSAPPRAEPLRDMQRAWIAYRDAACGYIAATWGGGTGTGPAYAECLMRRTAEQTLLLEDRLAGYDR